ncbi:hypothetical protein GZ982_30200 (plasmid) [Pseudomonas fluorescens]|nr:hypothetical protein GZ982_30200 [Pseudomonas fluorescens]
MSRFTFCNCPAGFKAAPERHAPDCPGRSGSGKGPTPLTMPIFKPDSACAGADDRESLVLQVDRLRQDNQNYDRLLARSGLQRDSLQKRLKAQHQRRDGLLNLLLEARRSVEYHAGMKGLGDGDELYALLSRIDAALNSTAEAQSHE